MAQNPISIVIADDEPITRMDLHELLSAAGYKIVAEAGDGFDALEACRKFRPNLALLDIRMPLLDGLSAAKMISDEDLVDTIVILTAYRDVEFINDAKSIGISGYLVKPIDEKSLIPSIEVMVERGREFKKLRREMQRTSNRLNNRSTIERAKGRIMEEQNMSENQAYTYIREMSLEKGLSMRDISEIILKSKKLGS
ncbi:MAG: response regulator [Synergistaceae bacterium]|nr:response regulator [Candidatus Equadaptatus faecalis]